MQPFDFEFWSELARRDPPAFFRERERVIGEFINANPLAAERLRVLQEQVDGLRAVAGTPMMALQGIFSLIDDHLTALGNQFQSLREESDRLRELARRLG